MEYGLNVLLTGIKLMICSLRPYIRVDNASESLESTDTFIRTLRKRYYFHRPAKASSSNLFSHKYRLFRNFAISMVQKVKFAFLKSLSSSIRSPKQLWSLYHSLDPNCECIPHLQTNGTITAESLISKANLLNCFFYSCFSSQSSTSYELSPSYHPELSNIECSEEVEILICSLETKTSTGYCPTCLGTLSTLHNMYLYLTLKLYNSSPTTGCFTTEWKCSNVTPSW